MVAFLENLKALAFLLIFISSYFYYRKLKITKREKKLSVIEMSLYIITSIALPAYAFLYLLLLLAT